MGTCATHRSAARLAASSPALLLHGKQGACAMGRDVAEGRPTLACERGGCTARYTAAWQNKGEHVNICAMHSCICGASTHSGVTALTRHACLTPFAVWAKGQDVNCACCKQCCPCFGWHIRIHVVQPARACIRGVAARRHRQRDAFRPGAQVSGGACVEPAGKGTCGSVPAR